MPIRETTITPAPPGDGRALDVVYPIPEFLTVGVNVDPPGPMMARQGFVTNAGYMNVLGAGIPPTPRGPAVYGGRVAWKVTADGGSAEVMTVSANLNFTVNATVGGAPHQGDYACWRVLAILAFGASPALGDFGLELTLDGNQGNMSTAGVRGMALAPQGAGQVNFQARRSDVAPIAPFTVNDVMPAVLDTTEYNAYELRLVPATDTTQGFVRVLINNRQQAVYPFDGATLPDGGVWTVNLCNRGGSQLYVPIAGLRISAGPTEAATL